MPHFQWWTIDTIYKEIKLAKPKLASWNANAHPEQVALQKYLDDIEQKLHPLPGGSGLFLHMQIDVENRAHLLYQHDLDNYLYPVVQRLGASRFKRVSAIKRVGGGSYLQIGQIKLATIFPEKNDWTSFFRDTKGTSLQKPAWKCSSQRNWTSLWKPTIDAMGPILGEPNPNRPFHPNDDRVVSLTLHLNVDDLLEWSVYIGMMWRLITLQ